jgi:hypothetical protein
MSALWSALIATATDETKQRFVTLAREGENLLTALGGSQPQPSAFTFSAATDRAAWDRWTDRYAELADQARGMSLGVLFAGASNLDLLRADPFVVRMMGGNAPPTWSTLRASMAGRVPTNTALANSFDWFASYDEPLDRGTDVEQLASRAHRQWWGDLILTLPLRPATTRPPTPTPPGRSTSGNGIAIVLGLLGLAWARGRKRRGK